MLPQPHDFSVEWLALGFIRVYFRIEGSSISVICFQHGVVMSMKVRKWLLQNCKIWFEMARKGAEFKRACVYSIILVALIHFKNEAFLFQPQACEMNMIIRLSNIMEIWYSFLAKIFSLAVDIKVVWETAKTTKVITSGLWLVWRFFRSIHSFLDVLEG